jgi:AcrR family transcriptional regulator
MSGATADPRAYHHGDLANTLMDRALAHITNDGVQKLSLRALAREVGVSATAPYRHFPSKRCLLAALATRGFRQLERRVRAGAAQAGALAGHEESPGSDPSPALLETRLMAAGEAYVQFAVDEPTTYHLMFGSVIDDFSEYEMLQEAASEAFAAVREILDDMLRAGLGGGLDIHLLGGTIWGGVHGIASLVISNKAVGDQMRGLDPQEPGPLQSINALRMDTGLALRALFAPLLR